MSSQEEHTMSSNNQTKPQGGILRSQPNKKTTNGDRGRVRFGSNQTSTFQPSHNNRSPQDDDYDDDDEVDVPPRNNEYDSDEEDAILASGDAFSMGRQNDKSDDDMMDEAVHSTTEIEEAKRKRGQARHKDYDEDDFSGNQKEDQCLSLITDQDADPDVYESNAGGNASCPVEPFNMDAEKESGLGYFDGDTYVFRKKALEGEEDAWLDGFEDENEEDGKAVGGLDSTSIWKPKDGTDAKRTKSSKYVSESDSPEEIGRRLVALLQNNEETVMAALTRHGSALRQLQSQEQKLAKRSKSKKRKVKSDAAGDVGESSEEQSSGRGDENIDHLKSKIKQTREVVEQLTELADALLFEGETDAYDLTKADWTHRFKLESNAAKRPPEDTNNSIPAKKARHNYFGETSTNDTTQSSTATPQYTEVMWEYRGNEDGAIHGPFSSQQMKEWTSCGYFVGESAVDIRRVGSCADGKSEAKSDADDLMADLMDDEDEEKADLSNEWMRSDDVDFNAYLNL